MAESRLTEVGLGRGGVEIYTGPVDVTADLRRGAAAASRPVDATSVESVEGRAEEPVDVTLYGPWAEKTENGPVDVTRGLIA